MRRAGPRWPLIRGAANAEPRREAVQFVDVVRQQVAPLESLPVPNRVVDVDHKEFSRNCIDRAAICIRVAAETGRRYPLLPDGRKAPRSIKVSRRGRPRKSITRALGGENQ